MPYPLIGKILRFTVSFIKNSLKGLALILLVLCLGSYYYVFRYTGDLKDDRGKKIDLQKLEKSSFEISSSVSTADGKIIGRFFNQVRSPLKSAEMPKVLKDGFIAAEDRRFNEKRRNHSATDLVCDPLYIDGLDSCAILRAGFGILVRAHNLSGASGIRAQLARILYADEVDAFKNREHTVWRKIKEAKIAIQLNRRFSKDAIVEGLLNSIYLGHGVFGINEASQRYWDKDLRKDQLTLKETVMLVSMNKSPLLYCPIFHKPDLSDPEYKAKLTKEKIRVGKAWDRYNWVLEHMLDDGYINQQQFDESYFKKEDFESSYLNRDEPEDLKLAELHPLNNRDYGYSNRMVKEILLSEGHTENELSYHGGLAIKTTIDSRIQKIMSEEFDKQLTLLNQGISSENRLEGAFIAIDVPTGNILALSGGSDFNLTQYNRVMASRSPGSGFKPFTYAAAIEYFDYDFFSKICNCPFSMKGSAPGKRWTPKNFKEDNPVAFGYQDLAYMLIRSVNLATLNLARSLPGEIKPVIKLAQNFGVWGNPGIVRDSGGEFWLRRPGYQISGGLVPLLPTAIGASDVNMLELANAYAVFFRNGIYMRPTLINEIRDADNHEIFEARTPGKKRVISEETSAKILAMMRGVAKIGTAKISMRNIEQPVACKTGTSDGPRDVSIWCGTPDIIIALRFGHDDYRVIELPEYMKKVSGRSDMQVSGGWVAGPLARKMFDRIYSEVRPKSEFSEKVGIYTETLVEHYKNRQ